MSIWCGKEQGGRYDAGLMTLDLLKAELKKEWLGNRTVNIVCHGHSVPGGFIKTLIVDTFNAYPHLWHVGIKQRYPHAVVNIIVTAIGGEHSQRGAERFERDVLSLRPDLITIDYSLNDRKIGLAVAWDAWTRMIKAAKSAGVLTILLTPTGDSTAKLDDPDEPLNHHAQQVRDLAAEHGLLLVDSWALFAEAVAAGRLLESLLSQHNHPNRAGHELGAAALSRLL